VVVDVPLVFIQATLFELIVYLYASCQASQASSHALSLTVYPSMANLSRTPSQFFIQFLFIFILTMTMYSFFRALGAVSASLDVGMCQPCFPRRNLLAN
jgi:3-methyladenine DNA glycosylase Tag